MRTALASGRRILGFGHSVYRTIDPRVMVLREVTAAIAPGRHDILTGTNVDGTLSTDAPDTTCQGWTSNRTGRAMLGHHNRTGGGQRPTSWNSAHLSSGCSQIDLRSTLGDALIYCFAAQ